MSFYKVELSRCLYPGCKRPATWQVHRSGTQTYGVYCDRHVEAQLKELRKVYGEKEP